MGHQISGSRCLVASLRVLPALWELGVMGKGPGFTQPHPSPFLQGEPSLVFAFLLRDLSLSPTDAPPTLHMDPCSSGGGCTWEPCWEVQETLREARETLQEALTWSPWAAELGQTWARQERREVMTHRCPHSYATGIRLKGWAPQKRLLNREQVPKCKTLVLSF